ncbi:LppX_LprAFG lipoprotein [Mycobacterium sp.]|uniref:LppX_LprAFG lipoprotein n=1 Tax=Mycobacterium sp. TaxID=1785 RepID=UPI002C93DD2F|nr:LppX_LprAFG lipoprotein [Mycobacterium sp.]HTQ22390.1 LppX_LprAFG lipoprotein [Mycobacterium sp.]
MRLPHRTVVAAAAAAFAVVFALGGCSNSNNSTGTGGSSVPNVDAATVVKDAAAAMRQVTGMHLTVAVQGDVPNLSLTKLDGDVSSTPQTVASGSATLTVGQKPVDSKFVFVDGHLYSDVADPGGKYNDYGDGVSIYDVGTLLNPDKGLANILTNLKDLKVAGSEQVGNVATTKITGTSSSNDIARLAGRRLGPETETPTPTTVWIASDGSHHLVKLQIVPVENSTVTLTMSDWGKQVTATKPPTV